MTLGRWRPREDRGQRSWVQIPPAPPNIQLPAWNCREGLYIPGRGLFFSLQPQTPNEQIREFVTAGHGNLAKVKQMLEEHPELINATYYWKEGDSETAIQAAAQVGSASVAEFLLSKGAPLGICTAAMLGRTEEVKRLLDANPENVRGVGGHGIPLLPHSVWSGNIDLVRLIFNRGATEGANLAFQNAVTKNNAEIVQWLLENARPDINAKNYQGKTPLTIAKDHKNDKIVEILSERGASE